MKFFQDYKKFSVNENLMKESTRIFSKMSAYTLMHIASWIASHNITVLGDDEYIWYNKENDNDSHLTEVLDEELFKFAIKHKDFFNKNFKQLAVQKKLTNISRSEISKELNKFKYFYIFRNPSMKKIKDGLPFYSLMGTNFPNLKTMRNDNFYNAKDTLHTYQKVEEITKEEAEEYLVDAKLAGQKLIDKVWDKRIEEDPTKIKDAEEHVSTEMKKKWKNLKSDFSLFDETDDDE